MSSGPVKLGVNIDHVATVRQARRADQPDIVEAARAAVAGGADGITVHLREDRRHIQDADVKRLKATIERPLNLEMAMTLEMQSFALAIKPAAVCLVPERREELTTEGGLDLRIVHAKLVDGCKRLRDQGISVSLFIDPSETQIKRAAALAVDGIELHTGSYAAQNDPEAQLRELDSLSRACRLAREMGLYVNAGHGLDYSNTTAVAQISGIRELNIGHAIVARALFCGLESAVREMRRVMSGVRC